MGFNRLPTSQIWGLYVESIKGDITTMYSDFRWCLRAGFPTRRTLHLVLFLRFDLASEARIVEISEFEAG